MEEELQILLVEDNLAEAELIGHQLRRAGVGFQLTRVETEPDFRARLESQPPGLILSDFTLPQFSGLGALSVAVEMAPEVPFIFVSGTIGEERAIDALRRGATDYVLKTNLARLVPAIERAVREARVRDRQQFSEKMVQDIVSTSQDWIWQVDAGGFFTFASPAVQSILGYAPEELIGQHFSLLVPADEQSGAGTRLPANHGGAVLNGSVSAWLRKDGAVRWLERNAVAAHDGRGELLGYRGSDRDVTLRREHEARIRRLNRVHRMLSSINSAIVRITNRGALLEEACRIAHEQGGYDQAVINLVVPGTMALRPVASAGLTPQQVAQISFSLDERDNGTPPMSARVIHSAAPLICNNLSRDPRELGFRDELCAGGINALIILPLTVDGTGIGTLVLCSREAGIFDATEVNALRELTGNIGFALQYIEKEHTVEFLSYFDPATGLAKRTLFCERLARALTPDSNRNGTVSVVVFDVQRLSVVNDTYGRHTADGLLQQVANRLKQSAPDAELVAHFGGGTFAMVFQSVASPDATGRFVSKEALRCFAEPFDVEDHEIRPSIRSGVASYPHDGQTADTLVQNAEAALKHCKDNGERTVFYSLLDRASGGDRVRFEARLAGALARSEFVLHYQPKINIASGHVEGVEALLRWNDPETGLISPVRFISLLENTGMISEVGQWVFERAAEDCQRWLRDGLGPLRVAVNVSPVQLRRDDFIARAISVMRPWATDVAGIDVEITESVLMHDFDLSTRKLQRLQEAGMRIAIDDFGTGYSSMRRLATLPVDTLKIDQSFIKRITESRQDLAIVRAIVSLARSCNMTTVAEGVETERQLQLLKPLQCNQVQGYLYSAAVPGEVLPEVVRRLTPRGMEQPFASRLDNMDYGI